MADYPLWTPPPFTITPFSFASGCPPTYASAATWPTANRALFFPIVVDCYFPVAQFIVANGTPSGNIDMGVYTFDETPTKIVSTGSTAGSGATAVQKVSPTTTVELAPGAYYLALSVDNNTATFPRGAVDTRMYGSMQQASAFALPATATLATPTSAFFQPVFGIASIALP